MSAQPMALREINVDTLVSILTRRGRHLRDCLVTLRREKKDIFLKKTHPGSVGFFWPDTLYVPV